MTNGVNDISALKEIMATIDLGPTNSIQFMYAKLQMAQGMICKAQAEDYMKQIEDIQKDQQECAQMIAKARELQKAAKNSTDDCSGDKTASTQTQSIGSSNTVQVTQANNANMQTQSIGSFNTVQVAQAINASTQTQSIRSSNTVQVTQTVGSPSLNLGRTTLSPGTVSAPTNSRSFSNIVNTGGGTLTNQSPVTESIGKNVAAVSQVGTQQSSAFDMPQDMVNYFKAHGLSYDTTSNDPADAWDYNLQSLTNYQETIGNKTQTLMVYLQDFISQYNSYTQGASSAISKASDVLTAVATGR